MICPKCKREHDGPLKYCDKCLKKNQERKRRQRENRIAAGMCVQCGKNPHAPGKKSCEECLNYERDTRKMLKTMRICTSCRMRSVAPNRTKCEICLAKKAELQAKEREAPGYRPKRIAYRKKRYDLYKKLGVCVDCGRQGESGFSRCKKCRDKAARRERIRKAKKRIIPRVEWTSYGLCYRCGQPALPGLHSCQKCKDDQLRSLSFGDEARFRQRQDIRWMNELIFGKRE